MAQTDTLMAHLRHTQRRPNAMTDAFSLSRQAQWETAGYRRAAERYREASSHSAIDELSAGQRLLREIVPALETLIAASQADAETSLGGSASRRPLWVWPILTLTADKMALIAASAGLRASCAVLDVDAGHYDGCSVMAASRGIVAAVRAQVEYDAWAKDSPDLYKRLKRRHPNVDKAVWFRWRRKIEAARLKPWEPGMAAALGAHLVGLLVQAAPQRFAVENRRIAFGRQQAVLVPTEATVELIEDVETRAEVARPLMMPMIIPPNPWRYE